MDETSSSSSGVNRPQWKRIKGVTGALEGQLLHMSFFSEGDSDFCRAEKEIYCIYRFWNWVWFWSISNFCCLGGLTALQTISNNLDSL